MNNKNNATANDREKFTTTLSKRHKNDLKILAGKLGLNAANDVIEFLIDEKLGDKDK